MADRYGSFSELARKKKEGKHFAIRYRPGKTGVLILAPHGGKIEAGTSELAKLIAGVDHAYYAFEGYQMYRNYEDLHLTSTRFDEPVACQAVAAADIVLSIHGHADKERSFLIIGGLDQELAVQMTSELTAGGFMIAPGKPSLSGYDPRNICNRNPHGRGVQLEISKQLRLRLLGDYMAQKRFVERVRQVIQQRMTAIQ